MPAAPAGTKVGGVSKTLTNEYWRSLGEGIPELRHQGWRRGRLPGGIERWRPARPALHRGEPDLAGLQRAFVLAADRQQPAACAGNRRRGKGIPVINVNDAVIPGVKHYVGNVQRDNGVRVAKWFLKNRPTVARSQSSRARPACFAAGQRTKGFSETIAEGGKFTVVASVPGNWDRQLAYDSARNHPAAEPGPRRLLRQQ
jgi:ribose transport system substrate-binding protein